MYTKKCCLKSEMKEGRMEGREEGRLIHFKTRHR